MSVKSLFLCIISVILLKILEVSCQEQKTPEAPKQEHCWESENFTVKTDCHVCSSHEYALHPNECSHTGYIEGVNCEKSGFVIKRCPVDKHHEMVNFWKFEASMIVLSLVSATVVMIRMRKLDAENQERIQRQISSL